MPWKGALLPWSNSMASMASFGVPLWCCSPSSSWILPPKLHACWFKCRLSVDVLPLMLLLNNHLPYYHVPSSFIIVHFLYIISVRHKCASTFLPTMSLLLLSLFIFLHIFTNTKFVHVTSTYYHSWNSVFEFTINVTYFHRVSDI
jgi:hypothetical protein